MAAIVLLSRFDYNTLRLQSELGVDSPRSRRCPQSLSEKCSDGGIMVVVGIVGIVELW